MEDLIDDNFDLLSLEIGPLVDEFCEETIEEIEAFDEDDVIDIMKMEIDFDTMCESKVVLGVEPTPNFTKEWNKCTNSAPITNLVEYLKDYYDIHNPIIREKRYKKYKELSQCRKLRWNSKSNKASKTGDLRVINAYIPNRQKIYLLLVYPKSKQEDLTPNQVKQICELVRMLNLSQEVYDE